MSIEELPPRETSQATQNPRDFDDSPDSFRGEHPDDQFAGASGVLFEQAMAQTRMAVCLCDPHRPEFPIIFANRAFRHLTGYSEEEIIGRSCAFLQGPETDQEEVEKIRVALRTEDVAVVELLNYRKDGTPFWNALHIGPIYDTRGRLTYFFGSQWDVSDVRAARAEEHYAREMARELSHRMKNMFAVISGIVNVTGRMRGIEKQAAEINDRVQALGRAYETTLDEASGGRIEIGPAIHAILEPYEGGGRLQFLGNDLRVPFPVVSVIGLVLHELAANCTKYGAWANPRGTVAVDWHERFDGGERCMLLSWIEKGGPEVVAPAEGSGSGSAIIDRLLRFGGGHIERDWDPEGLRASIYVPIGKAAE